MPKFILISDGRRVPYCSLPHEVDNLTGLDEVKLILKYAFDNGGGGDSFILRMGLFKRPSLLASRIIHAYFAINLEEPEPDQRADIRVFLDWMNEKFMPFLALVREVIPEIEGEVNQFLNEQRQGLTLAKIMSRLNEHVKGSRANCMFRAIALRMTLHNTANRHHYFSKQLTPILGFAMAKMQESSMIYLNPFIVKYLDLSSIENEDLQICFSNLGKMTSLHGPRFYGKLLVMTYCHFVFHRLLNHEGFIVLCLRRVCSGTSSN
jgi:hypothetical protein